MAPEFSIIVPTTGSKSNLERLLSSLEKLQGIDRAEILIVENPATGRLRALLESRENLYVRYLTSEAGVNHARNKGLSEAKGEFAFFLDDDCWVSDKELLIKHRRSHLANPWAFAIGGFYRNRTDCPVAEAYDAIQREWLLKNRIRANGETQMLLGGHFSMRLSGDLDFFDASIIYGGAETEYFFRQQKNGRRFLLIPEFVEHEPSLTLPILAKKASLQGKTHRRLVEVGLFKESRWISRPHRKYQGPEALYHWFFNHQLKEQNHFSSENFFRRLKGRLTNLQQRLCFYLENRELF